MCASRVAMSSPQLSLRDLLGQSYTDAVCEARAYVTGDGLDRLRAVAERKVDFAPGGYQSRLDELVDAIGETVCPSLGRSAAGAGTASFNRATQPASAPLTGFGFARVGEDGRLYLAAKSEHYHASLGHSFPGYALIDNARELGIPNATHNNTRGHITRLCEETLVRTANGIPATDTESLERVLASNDAHVLSRVINLETGSLAVEAALKMMLARFYRLEDAFPTPLYDGRTPVFLVIGDRAGSSKANYHGTTILTQVMRDLWPRLGQAMAERELFVVKPVAINDVADFERVLLAYDRGATKVAGFLHEIVLMNYGGIRLTEPYLQRVYALCNDHDVPILVDEIQSCIWSPELFMFREYGLQPDFVSVGKGFPGGEYPASKILTTSALDNLNQFGALVTNGQEELASIAYLVTIAFAEANRDYTSDLGETYEHELRSLAQKYPTIIDKIEGRRHLASIFFHSVDTTVRFTRELTAAGIDISAHTYKAECPPAALTKIPLVSTYKMVEFLISKMDRVLQGLNV
ncbi:MAG: aminotransferase class III-fold pyridoxal phosphate-dependent enzyme [Anaerolineae bacterium]|nr:aminotransferase class III-fold pyridoxal phosphate-dependent enzyme [Anaerolineae bacterium]